MDRRLHPASREPDLALRDRCLARPAERKAWEELYQTYAPLIRSRILAGRRAFPDHEVQDLVQAVFLKLAAGALERFEGRSSLKVWLLTLADSVRITENRRRLAAKRGRGRTVSIDDVDPSADGTLFDRSLNGSTLPAADDPESAYIDRKRAERLRDAVARLSDPRDREIVGLYFAEEPAVDREIAARLGMPLNTVTWRRLKAMKELKRHLTAPEGERL
jgi:RNA polymerase sigma factor (sigma-70 family)